MSEQHEIDVSAQKTGMTSGEVALHSDQWPSHRVSTTEPSRGAHVILLVDDEPRVLSSLRRALKEDLHKILTAESASAAFNILADHQVDLILSDHQMPGMSGVEFLKTVRRSHPEIVRIMLTGAQDSNVAVEAVNDGAVYKFITKPWNNDDLRLTVKLALAQRDLLQENARLKQVARKQRSEIGELARLAAPDRSSLGSLLVRTSLLMPGQWEMIETFCRQRDVTPVKAIIDLGMMDEQELHDFLLRESKADVYDADPAGLDRSLSRLLPRSMCEKACLVPVSTDGHRTEIAIADPLDLARLDQVRFALSMTVTPRLARPRVIEQAILHLYGDTGTAATEPDELDTVEEIDYLAVGEDIDLEIDNDQVVSVEQLMAKSSAPTAVRTVNAIITEAIRCGASDIHVEPRPNRTLVRYRVDGMLRQRITMPASHHLSTVSRFKVLAKMDIAEHRIPQDGRISVRVTDRVIDLRVSSIPTIYGEKVVCRLLDKSTAVLSLEELGMETGVLEKVKTMIATPQGLIITTGPTGSGKTTSLYAMMKEKMTSTQNFVTIEDPVEYILEAASQVYVHSRIGLTFASTLRATLRQDPDVILVGEIRDLETARAAFQAAMTGHLVFSTLHTNSAVATVSRLLDLGIEPYLVASSVQGIIAQRLVRRVCPFCRELRPYDTAAWKLLGSGPASPPERLHFGRGCDRCDGSGYAGRVGLYEVLVLSDELRQLLNRDYLEARLISMTRAMGIKTLLDDGVSKILQGDTTLDELLRVLGPSVSHDRRCNKCGEALDFRFLRCPFCGGDQQNQCPRCQSYLDPEWKFCPFCTSPPR